MAGNLDVHSILQFPHRGSYGELAWALIYHLLPAMLRVNQVSKRMTLTQLLLYQIGVYGVAVLMGLVPGYTGGTLR